VKGSCVKAGFFFYVNFFIKAAHIMTKSTSGEEYTVKYRKENGLMRTGAAPVHYIIYIDRIWLIDFVTGTYLLFLTGQAFGLKWNTARALASAAAGAAAFVMLLLLPGIGMVPGMLLQILCIGPFLLKAAFSLRTKETVVKAYACMNGFGLLLGGALLGVSAYVPGMRDHMGMGEVLLVTTAVTALAGLYLRARKKRKGAERYLKVKLDFYGEALSCTGFVDSGNSLYEPYRKRPVCILEKQAAGSLIGRVPPEKFCLVPFHSIGKKHGLLTAVELPLMEVEDQEQKRAFRRVVVALSDGALTGKRDYQVILHPEFVNQEE